MSKNTIITISREYGSGGRYIGEQVAKRLGIDYYDKDIIAKVAEKTGLAHDFVEQHGEYAPHKSVLSYAFIGRDATGMSVIDSLNAAQRNIILELADKGPCVIVGRCADYILKDRDDVMHVFILGNREQKKERIMSLYGKTEAEALKLLKEVDKKRSVNYNYCTDQEWGRAHNYTLMLNSSEIGIDNCVDVIVEAVKRFK